MNFRIAVTLQDLAQLKIDFHNPDDAVMHLRESDSLLWGIKADDSTQITTLIMKAVTLRNHDLFKKTQVEVQKRINDPKKGSDEDLRKENREFKLDFIFASVACVAGYSACYFLLKHYDSK